MPHKIILVDDDPVARIYISESLLAKGFEVTVFESGTEALAYSEISSVTLAIIDTYMPEISGIELLANFRSNPDLKDMKVFIMSADRDCYDLLAKAGLVADKVMLKPIKISDLLTAINELE